MIKIKNFFNRKWLIIAVTFTAVVLVLTHLPQGIMPPQLQVIGLDKLAHVSVYGAITLLFILSLRTSPTMLSALLLFLAILAVGAIDELTQPLVHRTASLTDWLADVTGIFVVFVFKTVQSFSNHRQAKTTNHTAISEN